MNQRRDIKPEDLGLQRSSRVGRGMEIEMFVKRANGDIDQTVDYPLFTATARETGDQIFLEFNCNGHEIAIPIDAIEKMLKAAKEDVHSEEWFDQNE